MRAIFAEYGVTLIAVITTTMFLLFVSWMFTSDKNIRFIFKTHSLYSQYNEDLDTGVVGSYGDPLDALNGVSNANKNNKVPHFELTSELNDIFKIEEYKTKNGDSYNYDLNPDTDNYRQIVGYNNLVSRVTDEGKLHVVLGDGTNIPIEQLELVIVTYEPEQKYTYGGSAVQKVFMTEQVDALDKFGNRIYNPDTNSFEKAEQIKYESTKWHRHSDDCGTDCEYKDIENFKINMRVPNKFKVIYRYQDNAMKCEYIKLFRNEVISAFDGLRIDGKITD